MSEQPSLSGMFKQRQAPGSWSCNECYVTNKATDDSCVACCTLRPGASASRTPSSSLAAPTPTAGRFFHLFLLPKPSALMHFKQNCCSAAKSYFKDLREFRLKSQIQPCLIANVSLEFISQLTNLALGN